MKFKKIQKFIDSIYDYENETSYLDGIPIGGYWSATLQILLEKKTDKLPSIDKKFIKNPKLNFKDFVKEILV